MFHWATGIPFQSEEHAGAYDELTFWEQIDNGEQYTPAKKFLICTPIVLYVIPSSCSSQLTNADVLLPKIPTIHPLYTLQSLGICN
jgi:hypothetical protein